MERKDGRIYRRRKAQGEETPCQGRMHVGVGGDDSHVGGACIAVAGDRGVNKEGADGQAKVISLSPVVCYNKKRNTKKWHQGWWIYGQNI